MASVPPTAPAVSSIASSATPGSSSSSASSASLARAASPNAAPVKMARPGTAASSSASAPNFQSCIETALNPAGPIQAGTAETAPTETPEAPGGEAGLATAVLNGIAAPQPGGKAEAAAKNTAAASPVRTVVAAVKRQEDANAAPADAVPVATAPAQPQVAATVPATATANPAPVAAGSQRRGPVEDAGEAGTEIQPRESVAARRGGTRAAASGGVAEAKDAATKTDATGPTPASSVSFPETPADNPKTAPPAFQAVATSAAGAAPVSTSKADIGNTSGLTTAAPAPAPAPATQPAAQIMPVLVSLGTGQKGSSQMTVRLDPVELGQVQIQIDRAHDASSTVRITAERPETLGLLMRDQHDLHRALDQAGVPTAGRTVSFQLADQPQSASGNSSGGQSFASQSFGGGSGNGSGQAKGNQSTPWQADGGGEDVAVPRAMRFLARSGLDITA